MMPELASVITPSGDSLLMIFKCHMRKSVTYSILRRMLGYDQQLHLYCYLRTLGVQMYLLISRHEYGQYTIHGI